MILVEKCVLKIIFLLLLLSNFSIQVFSKSLLHPSHNPIVRHMQHTIRFIFLNKKKQQIQQQQKVAILRCLK